MQQIPEIGGRLAHEPSRGARQHAARLQSGHEKSGRARHRRDALRRPQGLAQGELAASERGATGGQLPAAGSAQSGHTQAARRGEDAGRAHGGRPPDPAGAASGDATAV